MTIHNHNKNTAYNLDRGTYIGTYIKGTIKMTYSEWCEVYHFLQAEYNKAVKKIETYKRDSLGYALKQFNRYRPFSLGVTATFEIVKKYNLLSKYKNQNYAIKIDKYSKP